ncbi:hypothetical protein SAE01_11630 [Segetibacter aerophilus]|uniref:Uncharacterized protein n=1 Tax=Segetibacter aerophilus TaxID=670293 RepID=A0A512BA19_9BACT|nr:hypothetical protein SAE01_11630 [Segetibacter aerophilus]
MFFPGYIVAQAVKIENRKEVSQYGITWTFDKPAKTGQFITGDWWVVGPVTILKITPAPGPVRPENFNISINRWNDTSLKLDTTMRNGSMIVLKAGTTHGYDSRSGSFRKNNSVSLPLLLTPNLSLISSESNTTLPVDNFCKNIMWENEKKCQNVMKAAAVLTCLQDAPPEGAFRPPYAGTEKPVFLAKDIKWDLLPKLAPVGEVPSWEEFERYFQRPWIDHLMSWEQQELVPNENGPNYGREHARLVSMASLMVMLDVPKARKEKLTIELIQRGIDLYGIAKVGGYWNEGGGHSSGRKWPILFASTMLNNPAISQIPETAVFHEDTQTYYGKGWFGQDVLWQMIMHHGKRDPYEEKSPDQWEKWDKTSESYRTCCNAVAWTGTALAARYLKAIKLWGHDAHFDYIDRWMREDDPYKSARGNYPRPAAETTTTDPFVTAMWKAYRKSAPAQEMSGKNMKWVWKGEKAAWVPNPK